WMTLGTSRTSRQSSMAGETHEYTDMYPGMAKTARDEGFEEIDNWFETLAKAERSHANRYTKALDGLVD
ncbi:ferritin family protein, partial [Burkholderia pseudomallei]|uniref:ferritin family protein n=1 Tax=Burkholderia pseudomallei TaxID=28450 RepID=UPI000CCE0AF3